MKFLSNFDTNLHKRQVARAVEVHWKKWVLFVRRDTIYLLFKFYLPLFFIIILRSGAVRWIVSTNWDGLISLVRWWLWLVLLLSLVYFCRVSVGKFIDHYMDYIIITPDEITAYDQAWLLYRSSTSLDTSNIKSISIKQGWLWWSIFNYGSIIFYSEWDNWLQKVWQIQLNYIRSPRQYKKRITKIIAMADRSRKKQTLDARRKLLEQANWVVL